jgi:hypothetical protein
VKWDGYRALLIKDGEDVQIRSRNDKDLTAMYPGITAAPAGAIARAPEPRSGSALVAGPPGQRCQYREGSSAPQTTARLPAQCERITRVYSPGAPFANWSRTGS